MSDKEMEIKNKAAQIDENLMDVTGGIFGVSEEQYDSMKERFQKVRESILGFGIGQNEETKNVGILNNYENKKSRLPIK
jgi:hypothetical protein